ncbi:hypothetical protein TNCV_3915251 [Trichonephila clavipes]|nr:hypothetical protein TNCV_3915251 [Trichonephila clavipes]
MAAGGKGLPLGLAASFFVGKLNPSSSTGVLLRVSLLTSDLETLLVLSEVLFSAGTADFFRFGVTLATNLSRANWFYETLKSGTFRESLTQCFSNCGARPLGGREYCNFEEHCPNGNKFVVDGFEFALEIAVLVSCGWNDGDFASAGCINRLELDQLRYCRSIVSDQFLGRPFDGRFIFHDQKNVRKSVAGCNQMEQVSVEFVCSVAHSKVYKRQGRQYSSVISVRIQMLAKEQAYSTIDER